MQNNIWKNLAIAIIFQLVANKSQIFKAPCIKRSGKEA
jgi:hypothetical protein